MLNRAIYVEKRAVENIFRSLFVYTKEIKIARREVNADTKESRCGQKK